MRNEGHFRAFPGISGTVTAMHKFCSTSIGGNSNRNAEMDQRWLVSRDPLQGDEVAALEWLKSHSAAKNGRPAMAKRGLKQTSIMLLRAVRRRVVSKPSISGIMQAMRIRSERLSYEIPRRA